MGRFMSPDWSAQVEPVPYAKLGDPQSLNLYAYVSNNPLSESDLDGHCGENSAWYASTGHTALADADSCHLSIASSAGHSLPPKKPVAQQTASTNSDAGNGITAQMNDQFESLMTSDSMYSAVNFFAGYSDTITLGATANINQSLGQDSEIDHSSQLYWSGSASGAAVGAYLGATAASPIVSNFRLLGPSAGFAYAKGRFAAVMYGTVQIIRLDLQEMQSGAGPVPHVHIWSDGGEHGFRFALRFIF
jgi:hypothetical protein